MFCLLVMLRKCLSSRVRKFLNDLPRDLDETYERILREIYETSGGDAQYLLHCLAVAVRPLRVEELAEILTFDFDVNDREIPMFSEDQRPNDPEHELLRACSSLISIVDSGSYGSRNVRDYRVSRVVQFSHFSVKEFLTSGRLSTSSEAISCYHIVPEAAHTTFARASLGVLLCLDDLVDRRSARHIPLPLAEYAAKHWASHAIVNNVLSRVMDTTKILFDLDKPHFAAWIRIRDQHQDQHIRSSDSDVSNPILGFGYSDMPSFYSDECPDMPNPVYYSALCGLYDLVEHLIHKHPHQVNGIDGEHGTPLAAALHGRHFRVAELLLQHGADVDIQGTEEQTPLHTAIGWDSDAAVDAVQFLLKHGADVNAHQRNGSTPLHHAAAKGNSEIVRMLLRHGKTPLHRLPNLTREGRHLDPSPLPLNNGVDVNSRDRVDATPLHYASRNRNLDAVQVLLDQGADINAVNNSDQTPLHVAFRPKSRPSAAVVVQLLLERGADINARDMDHHTPLHQASFYRDDESIQVLLDRGCGANVDAQDKQGLTPLHKLFYVESTHDIGIYGWLKGHDSDVDDYEFGLDCVDRFGVAELLLNHGADTNIQDMGFQTSLHLASSRFDYKVVEMLLNNGADVHTQDKQGRTPLHQVFEDNSFRRRGNIAYRLKVVRLVVEHGADISTQDMNRDTPLHSALCRRDHESVQILLSLRLDQGANVNVKNKKGQTPLHLVMLDSWYSEEDRLAVTRVLMELGADANAQDGYYTTPLHLASRLSSFEMAWILLENGADRNMKDNDGKTPFQLARESILMEEMEQSRLGYSTTRRAECVVLMGLLYTF